MFEFSQYQKDAQDFISSMHWKCQCIINVRKNNHELQSIILAVINYTEKLTDACYSTNPSYHRPTPLPTRSPMRRIVIHRSLGRCGYPS